MKQCKIPKIKLKVYQQDWIPGFAAFIFEKNKIKKNKNIKANIVINIGSFLATAKEDIPVEEMPYFITETIIHEFVHVMQAYFKQEFSEKKVEKLINKYNKFYQKNGYKI